MAMFGLFKKKEKTEEAKPVSAQSEEMRAFAAQFLPEEMTILAVTGAGAFGGGQRQGDELITAGTVLTAWMEEDSSEIHRGQFRLVTKGDEKLIGFLQRRLPRDFIIKCKVRPHAEGQTFLLLDLPEPAFDPDLKAILEQQKLPVTEEIEGLGKFTLNRTVDVLQTEVDWLDHEAQLCFDRDENRDDCVRVAHALLDNAADWDARARALAADKLLDLANEWAADADEEAVTREDFLKRIALETIDVAADGSFQLWYNDGDLFFGHFIHVSGNLNEGVTDAQMEG